MTWEEKLEALKGLSPTVLVMRKPGDWYVSATGRNIGGDGFLTSAYGNGQTPQQAVENDWKEMTEKVPLEKYIVVTRSGERHHFRWRGYMWEELWK